MAQLVKKIKITTTIDLVTGLHIGGSSENVEIGGIDNPVIKIATKDSQPYIPGSSLKGKMRCLLEQIAGTAKVGGNAKIDNFFGGADAKNPSPSKIIVRDAYLTEASAEILRNCDNLDMPYTEAKWENVIDRVKGTAEHPRQTERIPAGVSFDAEFVINVWDSDGNGEELLQLFKKGVAALENDYLGGSGSRGYGQISFGDLTAQDVSFDEQVIIGKPYKLERE
jgi:CRISPR-associated protein Csm3